MSAFHSHLLEFHTNRGILTVIHKYKLKVVSSVRIFLNNTTKNLKGKIRFERVGAYI